jgi:hypothetical protein
MLVALHLLAAAYLLQAECILTKVCMSSMLSRHNRALTVLAQRVMLLTWYRDFYRLQIRLQVSQRS